MAKNNKKESFEESLRKLESIVQELESGEKGLERSLELFEKGVSLAKELSLQMDEAKAKVEVLSKEKGSLLRKAWDEEG